MRKGYAIKYHRNGINSTLVCPAGGIVARVERHRGDKSFVACEFAEVRGQTVRNAELMKVLSGHAELHYRQTTTRKQRLHNRLNQWVDYPIVKLIGSWQPLWRLRLQLGAV